jgi:hypothetical protein
MASILQAGAVSLRRLGIEAHEHETSVAFYRDRFHPLLFYEALQAKSL